MCTPLSVPLNNGVFLPTIGLGTYRSKAREGEEAIKLAIDAGYRHFDCAWIYGNEAEVGSAINEKINKGDVKREDIFITTKLWNNFHAREAVIPKLKESLTRLGMDYVDLYLVHWPLALKEDAPPLPTENFQSTFSDIDYLETWQGMEEAQKQGLTKAIGVSNFNAEQIERILKNCKIKPVVNEVECNPNLNQKKLIKFCKDRDVVIIGYCPLGRSDYVGRPNFPEPTIFDPKVAEIGKKYNKSAAQVVLNYLVGHLGIVAIPRAVTPSRIKENINIYDFVLDCEDISYLNSCNKNKRVCLLPGFEDHKYYSLNAEF